MKQITEDYVSFETAKLLKEKGFDGECRMKYREHDMQRIYHTPNPNDLLDFTTNRKKLEKHSKKQHCDYALCPTHQMALKWLRKVHNIVLDIAFEANKGWTFYVSHLIIKTISDGSTYIVGIQHSVWSDDVQQPYYKEYEEAVESALKYTLENLI